MIYWRFETKKFKIRYLKYSKTPKLNKKKSYQMLQKPMLFVCIGKILELRENEQSC